MTDTEKWLLIAGITLVLGMILRFRALRSAPPDSKTPSPLPQRRLWTSRILVIVSVLAVLAVLYLLR